MKYLNPKYWTDLVGYLFWWWKAMSKAEKLYKSSKNYDLLILSAEMIEKNKGDYWGYFYSGLAEIQNGEYEKGLDWLDKSLEVFHSLKRKNLGKGGDTQVYIHKSRVFRKMRQMDLALEEATNAVELSSDTFMALKWRIDILIELEDYEAAFTDIKYALTFKPKDKFLQRQRESIVLVLNEENNENY